MSVTTYNNGIPIVSIPVSISTTPVSTATLPWNGLSKPYEWSCVLNVTVQSQSGTATRNKFQYNGQDVNVGSWIASLTTGLAWQIVSISAKTTTTVNCTVQDINRYNTYRDPTHTGKGTPAIDSYVVFNLSSDGMPMVDPAPPGIGTNFFTTLAARFSYIQTQYDIILSQPSNAAISGFNFGDVIAIDEPTQTYVLADSSHLSTVVGTVTAVDDSGTTFTLNPIRKVVNDLNYLPGQVGQIIYTDNTTPGGLTTTIGGTPVYLQLRNFTQTTTTSSTFANTVTPVTTVGYTFNVNGVLATVGGTGLPIDIVNAVNFITSQTGVSAVLNTSPLIQIAFTAVDARAINFEDVAGSVTTDAGLTSAENGIKAAGLVIAGTSANSTPAGLLNSYGYKFTEPTPATSWTIVHNAGSTDVSTQVFDTSNNVIFPNQITIVDINTVTVSFGNAQAGMALLTIFK